MGQPPRLPEPRLHRTISSTAPARRRPRASGCRRQGQAQAAVHCLAAARVRAWSCPTAHAPEAAPATAPSGHPAARAPPAVPLSAPPDPTCKQGAPGRPPAGLSPAPALRTAWGLPDRVASSRTRGSPDRTAHRRGTTAGRRRARYAFPAAGWAARRHHRTTGPGTLPRRPQEPQQSAPAATGRGHSSSEAAGSSTQAQISSSWARRIGAARIQTLVTRSAARGSAPQRRRDDACACIRSTTPAGGVDAGLASAAVRHVAGGITDRAATPADRRRSAGRCPLDHAGLTTSGAAARQLPRRRHDRSTAEPSISKGSGEVAMAYVASFGAPATGPCKA